MDFSRIVCVTDLLGGDRSSSAGLLKFVREPIRQGCGIEIEFPVSSKRKQGSPSAFDVQQFRALADEGQGESLAALRVKTWRNMPGEAIAYLFSHLPDEALILSVDMPPWLSDACLVKGRRFVDLRHAPLKFGRDLYVALATNDTDIAARLAVHEVSDEELRLEAGLLSANVLAHRARMEVEGRYSFDLDGSLLIIGQHPEDPALIGRNSGVMNLREFSGRLRELAQGRQVLHMTDYLDPENWSADERPALAEAMGVPIRPCRQNIYQVLGSEDDVVLAGISAAALQEAPWFGKTAHLCAEPFVPLATGDSAQDGYTQIHFQDFVAPDFWHQMLAPQAQPPRLLRLPALSRHHGREALDNWGDYEKILTWGRAIPYWGFERSGGGALKQRVDALEIAVLRANQEGRSLGQSSGANPMRAAIERLKDTKRGQTAYILGNAPSLRELDISKLMKLDSFWCNRSYEMEKEGIPFRPKYYFFADLKGFQRHAKEVMAVQAGIKFFREEVYKGALNEFPDELSQQDVVSFHVRQVNGICMCDGDDNFSYDPASMCFSGWTSILDAAQFAYYMGYEKVYVGGVDLDFSGTPYFYGQKGVALDESASLRDELTDRMRRSFIVARKHFEKNGRILRKITQSPNLPLVFAELPELLNTKP